MGNTKPIYIDAGLINSKAFNALKKSKSAQILMHFLSRRHWAQQKIGKRKKWACTNNGQIIFTYSEAEGFGYSARQFNEAKKELVEKGFIDITDEGGIFDGHSARFGISERWRQYDTPEFEEKTIKKDTRKDRGWAVVHDKKGTARPRIKRRKIRFRIKKRRRNMGK